MPPDDEIRSQIAANARPWAGFWSWRDKPVGEHGAASEILRQAGINVIGLASRGKDDPPDCEGMLDGHWSAIEVTELVHEPTLARSIKAIKERASGSEPEKPEAYYAWDRADLLCALQERIEVKDAAQLKGGPYKRYILVIHTDEFFLNSGIVGQFLKGATFRARKITDVILGLSWEPASASYPVFHLELKNDSDNEGVIF
jgi:hypothetical protein